MLCSIGPVAEPSCLEARRQAHRIKGASATVGARQSAELSARLEAAAAEGPTADIAALASLAADCAVAIRIGRRPARLAPLARARSRFGDGSSERRWGGGGAGHDDLRGIDPPGPGRQQQRRTYRADHDDGCRGQAPDGQAVEEGLRGR
jgi:hypothetical protein